MSQVAHFWAYANDIYTKEAGDRLFPMIVIGQTAGAPIGAFVAGHLFGLGVSPQGILQISAILLAATVVLYLVVNRRVARRSRAPVEVLRPGGGFRLVFQGRYLLPIAALIVLLYSVISLGEYFGEPPHPHHVDAISESGPGLNRRGVIG